jgi:hypothetical protein
MKSRFLLAVLFLLSFPVFSQTIVYISPSGTGDGLSPDEPAALQDGLAIASNGAGAYELRLLQGTYAGATISIDLGENSNFENINTSGGWLTGYLTQQADPGLTVLDGENVRQVIDIIPGTQTITGTLEFSNLTIANGSSTDENGGGIVVHPGAAPINALVALVLDRVHFLNNTAAENHSGGALSTGHGFHINDCLFDGNSGSSGGAIHAYSPAGTEDMDRLITHTFFVSNSNYGNQGSSVYTSASELVVENSEFYGMSDGTLSGNGSGIYSVSGHLIVNRCRFENIRINYWASAVQGWNSDVDIFNSLFVNNKSGIITGYGTMAYYHGESADNRLVRIVNSTFVGNEAQGTGNFASAVHFRGNGTDQIDIHNSIFWDNGLSALYKESGTANIGWCLTENPALQFTDQGSVIDDDPLFDEAYRLGANSPAIDAGDDGFLNPDWTDLDGGIRVLGDAPDMGAFEYNAAPTGIFLSTTQIEENNIAGISFTTLEAEGQAGDEHLFTLATGDGTNDADNGKFSIEDNLLALDESANYEAQSTYFIYIKATDTDDQEVEVPVQIMILDANDPPIVIGTLADQDGVVGELAFFTIDTDVFFDEDEGDELTFSATLANGDDLPAWLSFDAESAGFEGTPVQAEVLEIKVIATDMMGLQAEATFFFDIMLLGLYDRDFVHLTMYPNPTKDFIYFDGEIGPGEYFIYSLDGKVLESGILKPNASRIDLRKLNAGMYILVMTGGDWYSSFRFVFE